MFWTLTIIAVVVLALVAYKLRVDQRVGTHAGKRALDRLHQPRALPDTTDFAEGVHDLHPDEWLDPMRAAARWREFEDVGPTYAVPDRSAFNDKGIRTCTGALYAAIYPADPFESLLDFELFLRFGASVQQGLIRTGAVDRAGFVPPDFKTAMAAFASRLGRVARSPDIPDLQPVLQRMELPAEAQWTLDLDYQSWTVSWGSDGLVATAAATEGYVHLFIADGA